jgi:hypothetical protein
MTEMPKLLTKTPDLNPPLARIAKGGDERGAAAQRCPEDRSGG